MKTIDRLKCSKSDMLSKASKWGVKSLLTSPKANPKVARNNSPTAVLHLAPAKLSGYEVCPMRSAGCTKACLHTAGNPAHMSGKEKARIARTKLFFEDRQLFMSLLMFEMDSMIKKGVTVFRLNGTSDIPWENVKVNGKSLMEHYPDCVFYDYTKRSNRKNIPSNYHLTFSLAEDNTLEAITAYRNGMNVAVVFRKELPEKFTLSDGYFNGYKYKEYSETIPVIDGDVNDERYKDAKGVIVGLKAKGKGKNDTSGFVRDV